MIPKQIDPRQAFVRVRIRNEKSYMNSGGKSERFLSVEGKEWDGNDASLTIRDWMDMSPDKSPQVWILKQIERLSSPAFWILENQHSGKMACIRGQSKGNDATVIQHERDGELLPYQFWNFLQLQNGNWLIQNINSGKFIGPQGRDEKTNDHYCIQYDNQTGDDSYQQWQFFEI